MSATLEDLLANLAFDKHSPFPRATLKEIIGRKEEMFPYLLEVLQDCAEHPASFIGSD